MNKCNVFLDNLISRMSMDQKIGALFTLSFTGFVPKKSVYEYITKYHCGGLRLTPHSRMFGSYVDPGSKKTIVALNGNEGIKYKDLAPTGTASEYKTVLDELQNIAQERYLSLPLHFSYDQEGGSSADFSFGNVNIFPKPMGLRSTDDPKLAYLVAKAVAEQSKSVGFNWIHSPVIDINTIPDNPEIGTRAYSDDVDDVIKYSVETCRGFKEGNMIATGKHFPGRGHSAVDAHYNVPIIDVDKETLLSRELLPYIKLIEKDLLPSIMIAHSIFPAIDSEDIATVSKPVLTGLLREELNFQGVITTDSMTMGGVATKYGVANACAMSLAAGADLVLLKAENDLIKETFEMVKTFIKEGKITEEELNKKVYRVLNLKYQYGLFYTDSTVNEKPEDIFKRVDIKKLTKIVAKKSVMIAIDKAKQLPLDINEKILVVEQRPIGQNSSTWHSGNLFENCIKLGANVSYLEIDYRMDDKDEKRFKETIVNYNTIILTNYFNRAVLSNKDFLERELENFKGKVIIVTNTPYKELSIPAFSETVVLTFSTSPDNISVVAKTLYGKVIPEGVWPLKNYYLE